MHLVCFIIRIYHDAQSPERQFITMQVTWTPIYHDARSPEHQKIPHFYVSFAIYYSPEIITYCIVNTSVKFFVSETHLEMKHASTPSA